MRTTYSQYALLAALVFLFAPTSAKAQNVTTKEQIIASIRANPPVAISDVSAEQIITSIHSGNLDVFDNVASESTDKRQELGNKLLAIFNDPKSSNFEQCAAAYYLGETHSIDAVDILASHITLYLTLAQDFTHIPILARPPAVEALVKIGTASIPALIRNLEESDDVKVRAPSLDVLKRIEGDKDVVQLRLQKALAAQKDPQKQSRLQLALKALATP